MGLVQPVIDGFKSDPFLTWFVGSIATLGDARETHSTLTGGNRQLSAALEAAGLLGQGCFLSTLLCSNVKIEMWFCNISHLL